MVSLAEIFQRHGAAYRDKFGAKMLPSHRETMAAIEQCRTQALGGHVYHCFNCDKERYSYHSCKNRHCPRCQNDTAQRWLERQQDLLLPVPHFLLTFTLPGALRQLARSNQKLIYNLLFRASAAATQKLAADPRFVGGQIGMLGVLQTWARDLTYHPHIHYLVPGGGLAPDGHSWLSSREDFFLPVKPLAILFRAKFRDGLRKTDLFTQIPSDIWRRDWVVHCKPVGRGETALKYLAPYIFRVALSNRRIRSLRNGHVTFRYTNAKSGDDCECKLPVEEFLRRFLQHVLPKGFVKVRYYGLFSPSQRRSLPTIRLLLNRRHASQRRAAQDGSTTQEQAVLRCPTCGQPLRHVQIILPAHRRPP